VVQLNNAITGEFLRRRIDPHNPGDVHLLIQRNTSGRVGKLEHIVQVCHIPSHFPIRVVEIGSRSAHGEHEFGAVVGERERRGCWRRDDVQDIWHVGDLDPKRLSSRRVSGLEKLYRGDLCGIRSIYAPRKTAASQKKEHTFASKIPGLVPIDGGDDVGKDQRTANVGGEGVSHRFVAPCVLQTSDPPRGGEVAAVGESQVSGHMATRHIHPSEEAIAELSSCRVVVRCKWKARFDTTRNGLRRVRGKKKSGEREGLTLLCGLR